jgi:hypothetical protein
VKRISIAAALTLWICAFGSAQSPIRIVAGIGWAGRGIWLNTELHTHSTFSDGSLSIEDIVSAGARNRCDVVAITDHADGGLKGGTPEYLEAIRAVRLAHPETTVIAGLEWNVPPGKGQEHANVLFPTAMETDDVFGDFKTRYDDEVKEGENPELALAGFAALRPKDRNALAPVVTFNHPSRRAKSTSAPSLTLTRLKSAAPSILIGFEGAPGHQRANPLGAYPSGTLVDRWDPLAATVGGAWDQWLQKGVTLWAALASADFHSPEGEFWPCEFATTHVYAPDRSVDGVIRALRAGSFFAEHGHIVTEAQLEARFAGQTHVFQPGETAAVAAGTSAIVSLRLVVPPVDYLGRENRIDAVELIGISQAKTETLFNGPPGTTDAFSVSIVVPPGGIVVRARGRRTLEDGANLMFYTNPIRINAAR